MEQMIYYPRHRKYLALRVTADLLTDDRQQPEWFKKALKKPNTHYGSLFRENVLRKRKAKPDDKLVVGLGRSSRIVLEFGDVIMYDMQGEVISGAMRHEVFKRRFIAEDELGNAPEKHLWDVMVHEGKRSWNGRKRYYTVVYSFNGEPYLVGELKYNRQETIVSANKFAMSLPGCIFYSGISAVPRRSAKKFPSGGTAYNE